jgi:Ricin-type beta-trefoil lectin domain
VLGTCDGAATQVWSQGVGNTLVNQGASMCLDDPNGSTSGTPQLQISPCDGTAGEAWPLPAAQAPPEQPPTGAVFPSETQSQSQVPCLDNAGGKAVAGNKVQLESCVGSGAEQWTMEPDGTFRTVGMCLDATGNSPGAPVVLNPCDGSTSEIWTPGPYRALVNQASGLCLDDPNFDTSNGTPLQVWSCNQGVNQQWWLPEL